MTKRGMRVGLAFAALCLLCGEVEVAVAQGTSAGSATADANDEVARGLFQAGKAAYEGGNYTEALDFFEQAYARSKRPQLLFNIGQVADRLRQDDKAIESFRAYLAQVPEASNRAEVESRIAALEQAVAQRNAQAEAAPVPTPEQTAAQAPAVQPDDERASASKQPVTKKWWFWTSIGAGVAVAAVAIAVAAGGGGDPGTEPLFEGSGGSFPGP